MWMLCTCKEDRKERKGGEREGKREREKKWKEKGKGRKGEGKREKGKRKTGKGREKQVIMGAGCLKMEYKKTQLNKMLFQMIIAILKEGMGGRENWSLNTVFELNALNLKIKLTLNIS